MKFNSIIYCVNNCESVT